MIPFKTHAYKMKTAEAVFILKIWNELLANPLYILLSLPERYWSVGSPQKDMML